jgi:ComF family protein
LQPPAFDATIAATDYVPPFDQLVLALKFGNQLALAALFARMLRDALLQTSQSALPDVLCAMPLSPQRLAERGFNQALEVAKPLARALGIPLAPTLVARVRDTRAQAMLRTEERQRNVRNVFALSPQAQQHLQGRHIGVVDDVITTGATLNELAAVLKRHGAARVTNFVFARTPDHRPTPP